MELRAAGEADHCFLVRVLALAADWRPHVSPRAPEVLLRDPSLRRYIEAWPRDGDFGIVATVGTSAAGAAWCRFFTPEEPGFGYVHADVPELTIGVLPEHRGQGIGAALLDALITVARERELQALSLSVEPDNPARRLYGRAGFVETQRDGALTMVKQLAGDA